MTNTDSSGHAIATTTTGTCNSYGALGPSQSTVRHGRLASGGTWTDDIDRSCSYGLGVALYCFEQ